MKTRYKILIIGIIVFSILVVIPLAITWGTEYNCRISKEVCTWYEVPIIGSGYFDGDPKPDVIEDPNSNYIEPTYNYTGLGDDCTWIDHPDDCYAVVPEPICEEGLYYTDRYGCSEFRN